MLFSIIFDKIDLFQLRIALLSDHPQKLLIFVSGLRAEKFAIKDWQILQRIFERHLIF